ncbi:unnamed protein product [Hymenolepis diminuta]|uniref:Uncharacterized protein n=1 Tax=Hymenolepis diminuta TaxID=6216 RepID=A0A564Z3H6_HYMDI|nr:unnamed protein product [Hymenolepis diminuta]
MEQFSKHLNMHSKISEDPILKLCPEKLILRVSEFHHDPRSELAFNNWFRKCKDGARKDSADALRRKELESYFKYWEPRNTRT